MTNKLKYLISNIFLSALATIAFALLINVFSLFLNQFTQIIIPELPSIFWIFLYTSLFAMILLTVFLNSKIQTKRDISQLYALLPDLSGNPKRPQNVEGLSEEISNITIDKTQEIDVLLEKENYRREFVGNVAHELKTPLFSIQGFVLTLIEGGVEDIEIRDKYLNRINKSVERLTYIVQDLDLITELESGNLKIKKATFDILGLTEEVVDLLENKAEENNVKLEIDKDCYGPIKVYGDAEKIEQVITNLVTNAINHSQKASKVFITFEEGEKQVKIIVKDNGMGIEPDKLPRIFERFYRGDQSRSRRQGGSGLGLAIVKHILEAHNQKPFVESEYGKGATFYFYLDTP